MIKDFQNIKKKNNKIRLAKKGGKKAMVSTWSDNSDSSKSESESEEITNFCLIAKGNFVWMMNPKT